MEDMTLSGLLARHFSNEIYADWCGARIQNMYKMALTTSLSVWKRETDEFKALIDSSDQFCRFEHTLCPICSTWANAVNLDPPSVSQ